MFCRPAVCAQVWVAPRDPDSAFVSFFICGRTEESTMLAYHVRSHLSGVSDDLLVMKNACGAGGISLGAAEAERLGRSI